jgi:hypothetical protein
VAYTACKKGTLLIPSGTYHDPNRMHLFIICTDECINGNFALVPVSTWVNDICDASCKISSGEHPFITKNSYAFYRKARIESRVNLENGVAKSSFVARQDVSDNLLAKIRHGLCLSGQTPRGIKRYFGCENNA